MTADLETGFNNPALERFRIMSKSHKGEALVAMIKRAMASPQIFVFGEILTLPNIIELKNGNHAPLYELLNIFAYGRLSDYDPKIHPELDAASVRKLQCLTLVSLANENKSISYDLLFKELKFESVRDLEDLIIDSIYYGLIKAKMDQKSRVLRVQSAVSRDIKGEEDLSRMVEVLIKWSDNCESVLAAVEAQVETTKTNLEEEYQHRVKIESEVVSTKQALLQDEQNKVGRANESHSHHPLDSQPSKLKGESSDRKKGSKPKSGFKTPSMKSPKFA